MLHSGHHIVRSWKQERWLLRISLAALLPTIIIGFVALYLQISLLALGSALLVTLMRLVVAYVISVVVGVSVALVVANNTKAGESWVAVFDVAQNIPSFALIPLFVMAMGYSSSMIIAFAVTSIVWPILFSTLNAARSAKPSLNEAATMFGAHGWKRIVHFLLPLSYPAIITGSIVGVSIGWEAVIGAEIIGSVHGIGTFLNTASIHGNTVLLAAGISSILLVVFIINRVVWSPILKKSYAYSE
jgi:NitT/TauT family transport system permease protein